MILLLKMPRQMKAGDLGMRPLRMTDGPAISLALRDVVLRRSLGIAWDSGASWLSVWWWLRTAHLLTYCICHGSQRVGLMGLSGLIPGVSAEVSLVIFPGCQGRGYGTRTMRLFVGALKREKGVRRLRVSVKGDNLRAVSFWGKIGFIKSGESDGIMRMDLALHEKREVIHGQPDR